MGQYLPDEAKDGIDYEYVKQLENLGEDEECCYLIPVFKDSLERVGTCSFMISEDKKISFDESVCHLLARWQTRVIKRYFQCITSKSNHSVNAVLPNSRYHPILSFLCFVDTVFHCI